MKRWMSRNGPLLFAVVGFSVLVGLATYIAFIKAVAYFKIATSGWC